MHVNLQNVLNASNKFHANVASQENKMSIIKNI